MKIQEAKLINLYLICRIDIYHQTSLCIKRFCSGMQSSGILARHPANEAFHDGRPVLIFCLKAVSFWAEQRGWDTRWWGWKSIRYSLLSQTVQGFFLQNQTN